MVFSNLTKIQNKHLVSNHSIIIKPFKSQFSNYIIKVPIDYY